MSKRNQNTLKVIKVIAILLFVFISISPILWTVMASFKYPKDIILKTPKLIFEPTLQNFRELWASSSNILKYFYNSLVISISSTLLALIFASLAGYSLSRLRPRGHSIISILIIALRMLPPVVIIVPLYLFCRYLNILDTLISLIVPYTALSIPLATWMMRSFFTDLPKSLEDAAMIDGCGYLKTFWRIILPLTAPGIAATAIFCFILSWNDFIFANQLTSTQAVPLPIVASQARAEEGLQWGKIGGIITTMVVPVFIFTLFVQKYMIAGLAIGSVKE